MKWTNQNKYDIKFVGYDTRFNSRFRLYDIINTYPVGDFGEEESEIITLPISSKIKIKSNQDIYRHIIDIYNGVVTVPKSSEYYELFYGAYTYIRMSGIVKWILAH